MTAEVFSPEALDANRNGELSDDQRSELESGLDRKHSGLTGLIGRRLDPLADDVKTARVESIEGVATRRTSS